MESTHNKDPGEPWTRPKKQDSDSAYGRLFRNRHIFLQLLKSSPVASGYGLVLWNLRKETCMTYTALVKQTNEGWIGWVEEIPGVNCQEPTYEALMETMTETLREAIELNVADARAAADTDYKELVLSV
ncbi:MAG: type II toxin-antitoxin system HicB family antitoxin [Spirochaetota bacterium]